MTAFLYHRSSMLKAQCPMLNDNVKRTNSMSNAQCPMPNAPMLQCAIPILHSLGIEHWALGIEAVTRVSALQRAGFDVEAGLGVALAVDGVTLLAGRGHVAGRGGGLGGVAAGRRAGGVGGGGAC